MQSNFANRTAWSILVWAAALAIVRLVFHGDGKPLVDILAVAILAGVTKQLMRLRQMDSVDSSTRRQAIIAGALAILCWAGGIWLERATADNGDWVVGAGIGAVVCVVLMELLRGRSATPRQQEPGT